MSRRALEVFPFPLRIFRPPSSLDSSGLLSHHFRLILCLGRQLWLSHTTIISLCRRCQLFSAHDQDTVISQPGSSTSTSKSSNHQTNFSLPKFILVNCAPFYLRTTVRTSNSIQSCDLNLPVYSRLASVPTKTRTRFYIGSALVRVCINNSNCAQGLEEHNIRLDA